MLSQTALWGVPGPLEKSAVKNPISDGFELAG